MGTVHGRKAGAGVEAEHRLASFSTRLNNRYLSFPVEGEGLFFSLGLTLFFRFVCLPEPSSSVFFFFFFFFFSSTCCSLEARSGDPEEEVE